MDRLAAADSRLRVIHITSLPDNWFGKSHAMHVADKSARGEILLLKFAQGLEDFGKVEQLPKLEGKRMGMIIMPKAGKK